jgi:hypothetical protein
MFKHIKLFVVSMALGAPFALAQISDAAPALGAIRKLS